MEKKITNQRAPPLIRQTRTSAFRILKANPLMMQDTEIVKKMGIQDTNKIPKSVDVLGISCKSNNISSTSACIINKNNAQAKPRNVDKNVLKGKNILESKKNNNLAKQKQHVIDSTKNSKSLFNRESSKSTDAKLPIRQSISAMYRGHFKKLGRRSRSAEKFDSNKCIKKSTFEESAAKIEISQSMEDITKQSLLNINISPIQEKKPNIIFKTPAAYNRRSVIQSTSNTKRKSLFNSYASTPAPVDLEKRLNSWLAKRGKSLGNFHHLKCFGLNRFIESPKEITKDEENKENIEAEIIVNSDGSFEDLYNKQNLEVNELIATPENYSLIVRDALNDLNKLIQDGYPLDQCEAWLGRIRQKYHGLDDEPLYWECRATVEQCRGNISTAVEHYRKAIIQGAEIQTIEASLDQLLQKFSLLNINSDFEENDVKNKRIILDARNAFKSTIIQFAVHERTLKKQKEDAKQIFTVTPVRRSTRLSLKYSARPGVKLCTSLKELDLNEGMQFKTNSYLSLKFN